MSFISCGRSRIFEVEFVCVRVRDGLGFSRKIKRINSIRVSRVKNKLEKIDLHNRKNDNFITKYLYYVSQL